MFPNKNKPFQGRKLSMDLEGSFVLQMDSHLNDLFNLTNTSVFLCHSPFRALRWRVPETEACLPVVGNNSVLVAGRFVLDQIQWPTAPSFKQLPANCGLRLQLRSSLILQHVVSESEFQPRLMISWGKVPYEVPACLYTLPCPAPFWPPSIKWLSLWDYCISVLTCSLDHFYISICDGILPPRSELQCCRL